VPPHKTTQVKRRIPCNLLNINKKAHFLQVSGNKRVTKYPNLTVCSGLSDVKDNSFF
jgi:hypothetical protein